MVTPMFILKLVTSLVLALLPIAVLIRDLKFHDKRTTLHHKITRAILVTWFVASLAAVVLVWHETYRSAQLDSKVDELVDGKNELLDKIKAYQTNLTEKQKTIEELQTKAKQASQGITRIYWFNGTCRTTDGPNIHLDDTLIPTFKKMVELQDKKSFIELSQFCEQQIRDYPLWPTPHVFLGVAKANLGDVDSAIRALRYFLDNAPSKPL